MTLGLGIILGGGQARRLGGVSKAEIIIGGKTCFERVYAVLSQSLDTIALSTNQAQYTGAPYNRVSCIPDYPAKARGGVAYAVLGSLNWAKNNKFDYIVTTPVDTPFLPTHYASVLIKAYKANNMSNVYKSDGRVQGLHALWPVTVLETLKDIMLIEDECKIDTLHKRLGSHNITCDSDAKGSFFNINTPKDLAEAQKFILGREV